MKNEANVALGAVLMYFLAIMPGHRKVRNSIKGKYYAHRGLHDGEAGIPENTMAAFRRAVDAGFGIELDVQLTKDEEVVVFHDFDLKRVCSAEGEISDFTYEQLQRFAICGTQERIPRLSDVLKLVQGRVPLLIELKYKGMESRICERTDEVMRQYHGEYAIESFHPRALWWYRRHRPEICADSSRGIFEAGGALFIRHIGYVVTFWLIFIGKPDFIAYDIRDRQAVSKNICRCVFGCPSAAWTVRSGRQLEEAKPYYDSFIFEGFLPVQPD